MNDTNERSKSIDIYCCLTTILTDQTDFTVGLKRARASGFTGVEGLPPLLADAPAFVRALEHHGLTFGAALYLPEHEDPIPWFERAATVGAKYIAAQVDGYWRDDAWIDERSTSLLALGKQYGLPFYLETHRGRYTQDLRRTLALLDRLPTLMLCGDFSHYVVSGELRAPWPQEWKDALYRVASRCGLLHARMNNGQRVQDPLFAIPAAQRQEFIDLWIYTARTAAEQRRPGVVITMEVLPPDYQMVDQHQRPIGDIWQDTVNLRDSLLQGVMDCQ